ncbi:unnamed protein product [Hyaloperonospora brassicae]|uniref:tyrosine--tRNA ligase n=1 Tax=Hyaloperonospora brassicae TaxID=162125 RepID=A0AAV0U2S2_HYABA|nr:unnamed protein product [Hyaloperonospora brassicae]
MTPVSSSTAAVLKGFSKLVKLAAITGAPLSAEVDAQLHALFAKKVHPIAYDGFEPSGRVTLAAADTHALLNNKFGGDLKKLQSVSLYMVEVWKALGLDADKSQHVEIMLASTETARHAGVYWSQVLDAAGRFTVERVQQCAPIMGRNDNDTVHNTNRILYPLMQLADGFLLQADIYQLGADQERGNELVREYVAQKDQLDSPVFLTHPLLLGLKQDQFKMTTTDAESAIYVDDTAAEVNAKIKKAFCVPGEVEGNPLASAGCVFRFWVADWFAMLSNKVGGNLDKIRLVGQYIVEIWNHCSPHHHRSHAEVLYDHGPQEKEGMQAAQILYPLMQCADMFSGKADICQLGIDQRKINMLARDYCDQAKIRFKPVILSHHMLMGLKEGQEKMSKSDPESAIFMEDASGDVSRKIENAFCPEGVVAADPILDYMKHIICPRFGAQGVRVKLMDETEETFASYQELEDVFVARQISGTGLKAALAKYLNEILEPVSEHFSRGDAQELSAKVRSFRITR